MTPEERKASVPRILREYGEPMTALQIAEQIGVPRRALTGDTAGTLFLLEAEGQVGRVGRKRGTKWFHLGGN